MCNHHHNLESEHMTFKVVQIAYVSEDSPELIGNQRSLSWYAKQDRGRRAAKLLGKWWRWTTERVHSISNITSKRCNNTVVINCLVYISRGIPTETMTTAWLYSIPTGTQRILHIICCVWKCRTGRTRYTVLNCYHTRDTGMTDTKLKNVVWGDWLNLSGTEISASSSDRLHYVCLSFQDTALHSLPGTGYLAFALIFWSLFLIPWLCVNKNTLNNMRYRMNPPVLIVLPVFGKRVSRATILHRP